MAVRLFTENDYNILDVASESLKGFGDNVLRWLEAGSTQPEYCFVNQANGKINAGVCFNPKSPRKLYVYQVEPLRPRASRIAR